MPVGLTTSVGAALAVVLSVAGGAAGFGFRARARTIRRDVVSRLAGAAVRIGGGELTTTGGSKSGDADCWACAAGMPKEKRGSRKVEVDRQKRRRCAAVKTEDMAQTSV
jgi:hypothetical protein